ncbi:MAG: hypothetical protein QOG77_3020, partial [Solirubrobacteraceae bacterium]|nr:hypothetical protein [Solirubrobacteraceae bacterium]
MIDLATSTVTRTGRVGHSTATDARAAGREAVDAALDGAPPRAGDLVLIFASVRYDLHALHAAAAERAAPAQVVGCTSAGAFADVASVAGGCVAALLPGEGLTFGVAHVAWDRGDLAGSARAAAESARARAGESRAYSALLLFADGMIGTHGREFARGAYDVTSALVPLAGGAAGDDLRGIEAWTFGEGVARTEGLVAVWIDSDTPIGVGSGHGFRAVGCPHVVTATQGRFIAELDGSPALDVYLGELGGRLPASVAPQPHHVPSHPLGAVTISGHHDLYPVAPHGAGLGARSEIAEGTLVEIMCTDVQGLVGGARRAGMDALAQLIAPP